MLGTLLCYVVLYIMIKSVLKYFCLIVMKKFDFQFIYLFFFLKLFCHIIFIFIKVHFFQTFECSNESLPNSSCHF